MDDTTWTIRVAHASLLGLFVRIFTIPPARHFETTTGRDLLREFLAYRALEFSISKIIRLKIRYDYYIGKLSERVDRLMNECGNFIVF